MEAFAERSEYAGPDTAEPTPVFVVFRLQLDAY